MILKRSITFVLITVIIVSISLLAAFGISHIIKLDFYSIIFGCALLLIAFGIIAFLDQTTLISSNQCGKRASMSNKNKKRETRDIIFPAIKFGILYYLRPTRAVFITSGILLIAFCVVFSG